MGPTRRQFIQALTIAGGSGLTGYSAKIMGKPGPGESTGRKKRTLYYNDARHYYMYVFEPPIKMEEAWVPIDEIAGTAVDTFVYGVERGDGLFYPSKVGQSFGVDMRPFELNAYWRIYKNMQSLIDRGLDPLTVLIDRAHQKGIDFFASVRMSSYGGLDPKYKVPEGRGMAHEFIRDHQFAVLEELVTRYEVEGVELDFAAAPVCRKEDAASFTPVMTDYVGKIFEMAHSRPGGAGQVGARVYPTEEMCLQNGLDVRTWIKEGIIDYFAPLLYSDFNLDVDMPIDWLIEAAHSKNIPVYGFMQPYVRDEASGSNALSNLKRIYPTPQIARAAMANYWSRGVDGIYTWFFKWPLGDPERRILTELGDPELTQYADKHYVLRRRTEQGMRMGYGAHLPLKIASVDPKKRYSIPFSIADDVEGSGKRIRQVVLKLQIENLVSADRITLLLNGKTLANETCLREHGERVDPYGGQWLEFHLKDVRPHKGQNQLEISLDERPDEMAGGIAVEALEVFIEYGPYPSSLRG